MQFLRPTNSYQWQTYKHLELIPDSAPNPNTSVSASTFGLGLAWRSLLNALAREQLYAHSTEYLERCWALNYAEPYTAKSAKPLQKLWMLME